MGARRKNIRKNDQNDRHRTYFALLVIVILVMSSISYIFSKTVQQNSPEYIEQKLVEFYHDSCQLNPKVGFKTINGLRGAYAKGNAFTDTRYSDIAYSLFRVYGILVHSA